jgi:hypothetical protein
MGELSAMIAEMRKLQELPTAAARESAPLIEAEAKRTAAAGTTPDVDAWAAKKDGGRAMANVAAHVSASASGTIVRVEVEGPEVFHNFGAGNLPKRQIIADKADEIPAGIAKAIQAGTDRAFAKLTGGG